MDLLPTSDQALFVSSVEIILARRQQAGHRAGDEYGLQREFAEVGLFDLAASTETDDFGLPDLMLAFEEIGSWIGPLELLSTVLAVRVATLAGAREFAAGLAKGDTAVSLAFPFRPGEMPAEASHIVYGNGAAELVVVIERTRAYLVERANCGRVESWISMEEETPVSLVTVDLSRAPIQVPSGEPMLWATVLTAAMATGAARRTVQKSADYAKIRHQYGRPIGTFQAVKHRCADMAVRAEVARAATAYSAVLAHEGSESAHRFAHGAKIVSTSAAILNAQDNLQNHGGIGFTLENDAHRFVRRSLLLSHLAGSVREHQVDLLNSDT
jgi:hypothetical protein